MTDALPHPLHTARRWIGALHGALLTLSGAGFGTMSFFIVGRLERIAAHLDPAAHPLPWFTHALLERPWLVAALEAGAAACGVLVIAAPRLRWCWFGLGMLLLLAGAGALLGAFLSLMAPLYGGEAELIQGG
jgi:hypothetical protein